MIGPWFLLLTLKDGIYHLSMLTRPMICLAIGPTQVPQLLLSYEKFGIYGGKFVPETLISSLTKLDYEFNSALHDPQFQLELEVALRGYVGRATPLHFAQRLTHYYKSINKGIGPDIYILKGKISTMVAHTRSTTLLHKRCWPNASASKTSWRPPVLASTVSPRRLRVPNSHWSAQYSWRA
ncbi:hypothetical protein RDI58_024201 [Solanum bulbocastanum]|uniref:Uncharacterized protein n=1 Tax=Solanum bulbocastanum TaxID=147425 RepID=A0AAN8T0L8_SOLBU